MTKNISYTLVTLIVLTILSALISNFVDLKIATFFILILSGIKFIFVSFQFMELKKAHPFWKTIILLFLLFFIAIIALLI